jgi:hypothetical protein
MANALDIEIPATTVTAGVMYGALNNGWGDLDYSVLFKNYTPPEVFEELPALEHVLGHVEPPVDEPVVAESVLAGEPPLAPPTLPTPSVVPEPPVDNAPTEAEPPSPTPVEPVLEIPPPSSVTHAAPATLNGSPPREAIPTEEAARIIEAVFAHVSGQRGELGPAPMMVRGYSSQAGQPQVTEDKTAAPTAAVTPPAPAKADVGKPTEPVKPAEVSKPAKEAKRFESNPIDLVRRWLARRS